MYFLFKVDERVLSTSEDFHTILIIEFVVGFQSKSYSPSLSLIIYQGIREGLNFFFVKKPKGGEGEGVVFPPTT